MKVLVVYYSLYGHVLKMAQAVANGAQQVEGAEVLLRRVEEFDVVKQAIAGNEFMTQIADLQKDIPIVSLDELRDADAILFGSPTRYGNMAAQMKQLFDSTGALWAKGELEGKVAGVFTSTASTHGGQETTLYTMMPPLFHFGMIVIGVPYSTPGMLHTDNRGGTPYGASTIAGGRGELSPAPEDLTIAEALGRRAAQIAKKLKS